jgi:hypothetical protein
VKDLTNLPLSSGQRRLWIIYQQNKFNPSFNTLSTYHFNSHINIDYFQQSINFLFSRQHTIFSVFKQNNGIPYIEIIPRPIKIQIIDFSNIQANTRKDEILSFAGEVSREYIDIEKGPLFKLYLLKEDNSSYYFHAIVHHLIFDGWSRKILVEELSSIYSNIILNKAQTLEPMTFQSYDYVALENKSVDAEKDKELLNFWVDNLKGCPTELKFPYDYPRKIDPTGLGRRVPFQISKESSIKLTKLAEKEDTSLFNTMVSMVGLILQKYSGENDICLGIHVSERRSNPLLEKIFGLFTSLAAVRLQIDDKIKAGDFVGYTKHIVRNAIKHSTIPFEKILRAVNPDRITAVNPFFQVSISWLSNLAIPIDFGNIKGQRVTFDKGVSPFDITFYFWEEEESIRGDIQYNIDILEHETVLGLKHNFIQLVELIANNPDLKISEISVISEYDQNRIDGFNKTDVSIPDCLIQNFFEQQAIRNPKKPSIIFSSVELSYEDLEKKTNQLAWYLQSQGISSGDRVGICFERSAEWVLSILGVLKAGACYVPIDLSLPDDRINYMIEDSKMKSLITHSALNDKFKKQSKVSIHFIDTDKNIIEKSRTDRINLEINSDSLVYLIYTSEIGRAHV